MNGKKARMRFCLAALLSALACAAFYMLLYLPQRAELYEKESEKARLRQELAEAAAFRREHPDPGKEAKKLVERKRLALGGLPMHMEESSFLLETERRAAETGVSLLGVAPGDAGMADGYARASIRLSVRGDYFALLDYLYALEQRGRFAKIDAVRGQVDDGGVFTGVIELWIYARAM